MRYSTVSAVDGLITAWYYEDDVTPIQQQPRISVERGQLFTVEESLTNTKFCAVVRTTIGKDYLLQFTPDIPLVPLGDEASRAYEEFRQEIRERRNRDRKK